MHSGKQWGSTADVFASDSVAIQHLEIDAGGFCSIHCHAHKYNLFYVISGELEISVEKADQGMVDRTTLLNGESMVVEPGQYHQFKAAANTVALEVYWTELGEDIYRKSSGGSDASDDKSLLL